MHQLVWVGMVCCLVSLRAQGPAVPGHVQGYLSHIGIDSLVKLIPPAPETGDVRDIVDQDVFLATRQFKDTPRWNLAKRDADLSAGGLLQAFACTFGPATTEQAPHLAKLLARVTADSFALFGDLKNHYKRKRPFLIHDGPICVDRAEVAGSFDYPSGHSTVGYATGLILAELDPRDAPAILGRAREYGESRLFCGVHNASAVEAGRVLGADLFVLLQSVPEFQSDLKAARADVDALRRERGAACAGEAGILARSPYKDLPMGR
jgi:acid phosphatase (class A)